MTGLSVAAGRDGKTVVITGFAVPFRPIGSVTSVDFDLPAPQGVLSRRTLPSLRVTLRNHAITVQSRRHNLTIRFRLVP